VGSPPARLRTWFLRNLLDAAERELGSSAVAALPERAPARLRSHLTLERLRASAALDTLPLDQGEEAILALEHTLGDGSGRTLERIACEMLGRQLAQAASAVRVGDLFGTVARLRTPLEHPFVDAPVSFDLLRSPTGFSLTIGIAGRPRATRLLGHLAAGAIRAAERFARESHVDPLRIEVTPFADRARVDAHYRRASTLPPAPEPLPFSRRTSSTARFIPRLSDEIAKILDPSLASAQRAEESAGRRTPSSEFPPPDALKPAPVTPRPLSEPPPAPAGRRSSRPPPAR
jgi:hypothetical protein